jgi:hypothetical protein
MKENNKFKVKTPHGYSDFDYIQKTEKDEYLKITLDNGYILKCSLEHPFKIGGEKVPAENLEVGTFLEGEETPFVKINNIQHIREHIVLYDLINVHENHEFYVNGILSSNCDAEFLSSGNSVVDARMLK